MAQKINRASLTVLVVLSVIALLDVVTGYLWPQRAPVADEGAQAHIFQLTIAALAPALAFFVVTLDRHRPLRTLRPLLFAAASLIIAFAALYRLEH